MWLDTNLYTHHDGAGSFNERNYGVEVQQGPMVVGAYRNSYYKPSVFAAFDFSLLSKGPVTLSIMTGVVTGYKYTEMHAAKLQPEAQLRMSIEVDNKRIIFGIIPAKLIDSNYVDVYTIQTGIKF